MGNKFLNKIKKVIIFKIFGFHIFLYLKIYFEHKHFNLVLTININNRFKSKFSSFFILYLYKSLYI